MTYLFGTLALLCCIGYLGGNALCYAMGMINTRTDTRYQSTKVVAMTLLAAGWTLVLALR